MDILSQYQKKYDTEKQGHVRIVPTVKIFSKNPLVRMIARRWDMSIADAKRSFFLWISLAEGAALLALAALIFFRALGGESRHANSPSLNAKNDFPLPLRQNR